SSSKPAVFCEHCHPQKGPTHHARPALAGVIVRKKSEPAGACLRRGKAEMEKVNVKGHSRILALSLMLLTLIALSGADDKNKKPENTPPRRQSAQVRRQAPPSRPTPPPQKSTNTNTYHPPNTTNTYHPPNTGTSTVDKGTGNTTSTTGGN